MEFCHDVIAWIPHIYGKKLWPRLLPHHDVLIPAIHVHCTDDMEAQTTLNINIWREGGKVLKNPHTRGERMAETGAHGQ